MRKQTTPATRENGETKFITLLTQIDIACETLNKKAIAKHKIELSDYESNNPNSPDKEDIEELKKLIKKTEDYISTNEEYEETKTVLYKSLIKRMDHDEAEGIAEETAWAFTFGAELRSWGNGGETNT
jgi:hypothetical protein